MSPAILPPTFCWTKMGAESCAAANGPTMTKNVSEACAAVQSPQRRGFHMLRPENQGAATASSQNLLR
jgi:hypothetical protein